MKKFVLLAAIACGLSVTSKAATLKADVVTTAKKSAVNTKLASPARIQLYMMEFTCVGQGWSIPVVGNTQAEMARAYMFYETHLDC